MTPETRKAYAALALLGGPIFVTSENMLELLGLNVARAPTNPLNPYLANSTLGCAWQAGFSEQTPNDSEPGSLYDKAYKAGVAARPKRDRQSPYPDASGKVLFEGDWIVHPTHGSEAVVTYDASFQEEALRWRAKYKDDGPTSPGGTVWLALQVSQRGGAVLFRRAGDPA